MALETDASGDNVTEKCPVRVGDECRLCVPGATGPHDCGLAYLVMSDPALRIEILQRWSSEAAKSNDGHE